MKRLTHAILASWVLFALILGGIDPAESAILSMNYPANPLAAHTGGFSEKSCQTCHSETEVNPSGGSLQIGWAASDGRNGRPRTLSMTLSHPELIRGGYQVSARFAAGPDAGKQAGTFVPDPAKQIVTEQGGIHYLSQTLEGGKASGKGLLRWEVAWIPPASGWRNVVFHVSAVVGDDDGSAYGDWVYVSEFRAGR